MKDNIKMDVTEDVDKNSYGSRQDSDGVAWIKYWTSGFSKEARNFLAD